MKVYILTVFISVELQFYAEVLSRFDYKEWEKVIKLEYDLLIENGIWELVKLFSGRKMIFCKWVFKFKVKVDGIFDRYKVRLVVRRFL